MSFVDRLITVVKINGIPIPFYKSIGVNSGIPGCWLPFIMCRGSREDKYLPWKKLPKIYNTKAGPAYIQWSLMFSKHPAVRAAHLIKPPGFIEKYQLEPNGDFSEEQADRLLNKDFLISSSRLNTEYFTPNQLKDAGLSLEERIRAKDKIELVDSGLYTTNPDEVNHWLCQQGANYIENFLPITIHKDSKGKSKVTTPLSSNPNTHFAQPCLSKTENSKNLRDEIAEGLIAPVIKIDDLNFNPQHFDYK